jgi:hypothetical protein
MSQKSGEFSLLKCFRVPQLTDLGGAGESEQSAMDAGDLKGAVLLVRTFLLPAAQSCRWRNNDLGLAVKTLVTIHAKEILPVCSQLSCTGLSQRVPSPYAWNLTATVNNNPSCPAVTLLLMTSQNPFGQRHFACRLHKSTAPCRRTAARTSSHSHSLGCSPYLTGNTLRLRY